MKEIKLRNGLVQIYTGDGKGKTTASLGLAWRAMGRGLRVFFIQFLKPDMKSGEQLIAERFSDLLTFAHPPEVPPELRRKSLPGQAWWMQPPTEAECAAARETLERARAAMQSGEYDLVICDEINIACNTGLITAEDILTLIQEKPEHVELVLTGQQAKEEVIAAADLVTEMRMIKHPFQKNILARKGIEF